MISLNFLEIGIQKNNVEIFIKAYDEMQEKEDGVHVHQLPNSSNGEYERYFITFLKKEGYDSYNYNLELNTNLTKRWVLHSLFNVVEKNDQNLKCILFDKKFSKRIEFVVGETEKGDRTIFLAPYFLKTENKFGFLIDYRFKRKDEISNGDIEVLKYSLSLDKYGKENKNLYSDKKRIVKWFIDKYLQFINDGSSHFKISPTLKRLPTSKLKKKEYVFNSGSKSFSQFHGVKQNGVFKEIKERVHYVFIFEDRFKNFSNELYKSLKGKSFPGTFSGLEKMFNINFDSDSISRVSVTGYNKESLDEIMEKVKEIKINHEKLIAIFIEPSKDIFIDISPYYYLKYRMTQNRIPLQVIDYESRSKKNALKWSTSGLALQIFAKLGGIPWVVKPDVNDCLILGIGSAHKSEKIEIEDEDENGKREKWKITKYFSYSICLDSSGLYKKLAILSETKNDNSFIEEFKENLIKLLTEGDFKNYKKCALHIPSKIRHEEVDAIKEVLLEINDIEFEVIKVNTNNRFFGYSDHNTCVPYESEYINLSRNEYLVWFEGLQYGKENISRKISNPVHVEFINSKLTNGSTSADRYLQDVLNLSGANWRGFNAKLMPISIYYSQIVAKYTSEFEQFDDFDPNIFQYSLPWFL